jgi:hypothetical protein
MPTAGRQQVDWSDIGKRGIPMKVDGTTLFFDRTQPNGIGKAAGTGNWVQWSAAETVALTQDAQEVVGQVAKIDADNIATIWNHGVITGPSSGTITRGTKVVGALATANRGYIRSVVATVLAEVAVGKGEVLAVDDVNNVQVDFGTP